MHRDFNLLEGSITPSTLYYGDCLDVMKQWHPEQVDLIYLDPPFKSNQKYNVLFGARGNGHTAQYMAFDDAWYWDDAAARRVDQLKATKASPVHTTIAGLELALGKSGMLAYVSYMAERLLVMRSLLKKTGSIYLHCDPTASHYLRAVMDGIFGAKNLRNELIWFYHDSPGRSRRYYPKKHDVIFWYANSAEWTFNDDDVRVPILPASVERYKTARKLGGREYVGGKAANIGKIPEDVWSIPVVKQNSREACGYPTQKPLALLDRIVRGSSNPGDLVLDPFCGCGTAVVAAHQTGRTWAGIDISSFAVEEVMKRRLQRQNVPANIEGIPRDLVGARELAGRSPFKFESWTIFQIPGLVPNTRQVADGGVDGQGTLADRTEAGEDLVIAQVKAGKATPGHLRDFLFNMQERKAAAGIFITLSRDQVSAPMRRTAGAQGKFRVSGQAEEYPRVQFWSLEEWFQHDRDPRFLPHRPPMKDPYSGKKMVRDLWSRERDDI